MKYNINLIGKNRESFFDRALYFFLNYLRHILVITQLVVIGVLFYRFSIDQSIIDLKESIEQKKEIVSAVTPLLVAANNVNRQTSEVKKIIQKQQVFPQTINYIISVFPQSMTLNKMGIADTSVQLFGVAASPQDLRSFIARLQKEAHFSSVELSDIQKTQTGYNFAIGLKDFIQK